MRSIDSDNTFSKRLVSWLLSILLVISVCGSAFPESALADVRKADIVIGETIESRGLSVAQCPSIDAEYAIVMGADGTIYFERNATSPAQIASITKVMTALVALETLSSDAVVTVSENAAYVGESSASLQVGDVLSFDAALKGLMLSSGNDAAIAIAETAGEVLSGGTAKGSEAEQVFIDRMNAKAVEMGLVDTVFRNPHGLDDGIYEGDQHSCALDVATIAKAAMAIDLFRTTVATPEATISVTHADGTQDSLLLTTTDILIGNYEGACGIKTGFTDAAGSCFAGASNRGGQDLYAIVLKSTDEITRFEDTRILFDWVYEHTISYPIAHSDQSVEMSLEGQTRSVPIVAEVAHDDWIDKTVSATFADPDQALTIFDLNGNISQTVEYNMLNGDIRAGDKVGTMTFRQRNSDLVTVDMIACEDSPAPGFFEGIGIWWDRFFRGFSGQATVAESILINQTPLISEKAGVS